MELLDNVKSILVYGVLGIFVSVTVAEEKKKVTEYEEVVTVVSAPIEEIIVTGSYLEKRLGRIEEQVHIIDAQSVTTDASYNLGNIIENLIGVSSSNYGNAVGQPVIRGLSGRRIRVLHNDRIVRDLSGVGFDRVNELDLNQLDQIEVIRGPLSLLFANGSIGGTINVVDTTIPEQDFIDQKISFSLGIQSVSRGYKGLFSYQDHHDGLNLSLATSGSELESYEVPKQPMDDGVLLQNLPNSYVDTSSSKIGLSGAGGWGYAGFSYSDQSTAFGVPLYQAPYDKKERVFSSTNSQTSTFDSTFEIGGEWLQNIKFFYQNTDYTFIEQRSSDFFNTTTFNNKGDEAGITLDFSTPDTINRFVALYHKENISVRGEGAFLKPTQSTETIIAYYLSNAINSLKIDFGIQYVNIERQEQTTVNSNTSNISFSFDSTITEGINAIVNLSSVARIPSVVELFTLGSHLATQRFEVGNPLLTEERSNTIDTTFVFDVDSFFSHISFFASKFDNYIYLQDQNIESGGLIQAHYTQKDADFSGYELQFGGKIQTNSGEIVLSVARDKAIGRFASDNSYVPRLTPSRNFATFTYENFYDYLSPYSISLGITNVESQNRTATNETSTKGYTTFDFKYVQKIDQFKDSSITLSVYAKNLTNEIAKNHASPIKDRAPLPGRNIGVTFTFDF